MLSTTSEDVFVRNHDSVEARQIIPLIFAAIVLSVGLSMVLSGATDFGEVVRPSIVVFGGTIAGLLLTFRPGQLFHALELVILRAVQGGHSPIQMVRVLLRICEVSRREGLLGVAEIRSNSDSVEEICQFVGEAADEQTIRFALEQRRHQEQIQYRLSTDVFLFLAVYALLFGVLGSVFHFANNDIAQLSSDMFMPFVCGFTLAIMMAVLIGRLRVVHMREMMIIDLAYRAAIIMLEDNNVQRLQARLLLMLPVSLRV